jgi:hypothetical protein
VLAVAFFEFWGLGMDSALPRGLGRIGRRGFAIALSLAAGACLLAPAAQAFPVATDDPTYTARGGPGKDLIRGGPGKDRCTGPRDELRSCN